MSQLLLGTFCSTVNHSKELSISWIMNETCNGLFDDHMSLYTFVSIPYV